jgi:riboflavin transporter FmnP
MVGPIAVVISSVFVSFFEMISVSNNGPIGMVMNVLATLSFACTASFIYRKKHNMKGAVIGLAAGVAAMTAVMLLWNYLITPGYLKIERQAVVDIMIPLLLPFNLLKAGINAALVMLLYKPIVTVLRKSNLLPPSSAGKSGKFNIGFFIVALLVLVTCVLLILALKGVI